MQSHALSDQSVLCNPSDGKEPRGSGYTDDMATALKVALAVLLFGSVVLAYFGPPPRHSFGLRLRGAVLVAGVAAYAIAALALAAGAILAAGLAIAVAGELVCAAGWLSRGDTPPADEDDDDGGGGGGRGPDPPPVDWDAFERAFGRHVRERERQPV
jgi:hypothetical protein